MKYSINEIENFKKKVIVYACSIEK